MPIKKNNKNSKKNLKIKGGFGKELYNFSLIPGLATWKKHKITKKTKKNKQQGGFIRAGSTQYFNKKCN